MIKTLVISAFPACGKSYAFRNYRNDKLKILDSDSSLFSWLPHKLDGAKERNPDFLNNYIQHIKDNIGKQHIIFVSSHENVRTAMTEAGITFATVYPKRNLMNEFVGRMYLRGNNDKFIKFITDNWEDFMDEIERGNWGDFLYRLDAGQYLDIHALSYLYSNFYMSDDIAKLYNEGRK